MLLYNTQRAVFKNGDKCTLLCSVSLPCGAADAKLGNLVSRYYKDLYGTIYSSAKSYAGRIVPLNGRLVTLNIKCEHCVKKRKIFVQRTYSISYGGAVTKKKTFVDKFSINMTKQRNIP